MEDLSLKPYLLLDHKRNDQVYIQEDQIDYLKRLFKNTKGLEKNFDFMGFLQNVSELIENPMVFNEELCQVLLDIPISISRNTGGIMMFQQNPSHYYKSEFGVTLGNTIRRHKHNVFSMIIIMSQIEEILRPMIKSIEFIDTYCIIDLNQEAFRKFPFMMGGGLTNGIMVHFDCVHKDNNKYIKIIRFEYAYNKMQFGNGVYNYINSIDLQPFGWVNIIIDYKSAILMINKIIHDVFYYPIICKRKPIITFFHIARKANKQEKIFKKMFGKHNDITLRHILTFL